MFTGDKVMKQVFDEALRIRETDRQKARRRRVKNRQAKS
jgi:hypothetical protein